MSAFIDLTGKKMGRWTVIKRLPNVGTTTIWECVCDCGTRKAVRAGHLIWGRSVSCGCYSKERASEVNRDDITGMKSGRLTAIEPVGKDSEGNITWRCSCLCGGEKIVAAHRFKRKMIQSCGCLQKERAANTLRVINGTPVRVVEGVPPVSWSINMEYELKDFFKHCVLCGSSEKLESDHIFPATKGYDKTPGTAVILCQKCNTAKRDYMPHQLPDNQGEILMMNALRFGIHWESIKEKYG